MATSTKEKAKAKPEADAPEETGFNSYTVEASGWCAGKWRKKGSTVVLSRYAAKYENVTLKDTNVAKP